MVSGFDGVHENLAVVDPAGNLHVNSAATSYLHVYIYTFGTTAGYTSTVNVPFPHPSSLVCVDVGAAGGTIGFVDSTTGQLSAQGQLDAGFYTFPIVTTGIALYSGAPGTRVGFGVYAFY